MKKSVIALAALVSVNAWSAMTPYQQQLSDKLDPSKAPSENFEMEKWKINLPIGDNKPERAGKEMEITAAELNNVNYPYVHPQWFYTDAQTGAMVFAAPNTGPTTPNSKNTRSELRAMLDTTQAYQYKAPATNFAVASHPQASEFGAIGGRLSAALTVDAVSQSGDDKKMGAFASVIGQIHGSDNEPLKIYYRKLPNHTHGSLFWNYEINPKDKKDRFDISHDVFGIHDLQKSDANPEDGILLGELFEYEVNIVGTVMKLEFTKNPGEANEIKKNFEVDLAKAYPGQEKLDTSYGSDWMYYKAGAYNQCNQGSSGCENKGIEAGDYTQASFYKLELAQ
ncbi:polysaccharide lyase family 7 protein [Alginatibacterium sediminis]|uniref:Polysaccharide lyase family 7 protein n=1 Tax=Alginatibacterium sediminis TaxID=2164068 RepID=A0A420ELB4_9ALTE|nr:polysaccharide lyase family 7 protein [Alginatibacterium sediminis]RKF21531.1 polysaccharide lyase family 7 protein [Alginatibacterium sediminis]